MKIIIDSFFIENSLVENNEIKYDIVADLEKSGFKVIISKHIRHFNETVKKDLSVLDKEEQILIYGTIQFVDDFIGQGTHNLLSFYDKEQFNVTNFISRVPYQYNLNGDGLFVTFGMFKQNPYRYFDLFNCNGLFIRPNNGSKLFSGFVMDKNDVDHQINGCEKTSGVIDTSLILINKPKTILSEHRFAVAYGEILDCCQYYQDGKLSLNKKVPDIVYESAKKIIKDLNIYDIPYICDIALMDNGSVQVIEFNTLSTSDMYLMNAGRVFKNALSSYSNYIK